MTRVADIAHTIERIAPLSLQEDYDNAGLQVGDARSEVRSALVTLDVTEAVVAEAIERGAQLVVSHHPLIFRALRRITPDDYIGRTLTLAIGHGIALYAAHTNLDNACGGVNYKLADVLGLTDTTPLAPLPAARTAGLTADVARCCGTGLVGTLPVPMDEGSFVDMVRRRLNAPSVKHNTTGRTIGRVAICGGAGGSFIGYAQRAEADAYVTGEVGYHPFFGHPDMLVVEAGHYETEQFTRQLLADIIAAAHPDVEVHIAHTVANPVVVD